MTLLEAKNKVLALIEELDGTHPLLTADTDLAAKLPHVINQVMFELARFKKPAMYVELAVQAGQQLTFGDIGEKAGREVYQVALVTGVEHQWRGNGTVLRILESGTAGIDCFVYPRRITADTDDSFPLDLTEDALEILPYGVAADLLKSDLSADYGRAYAERYERMVQRLDPRNLLGSVWIEGGWAV